MNQTLDILATYFLRVAPAVALGVAMIFMARREPRLRIVLYLALFILLRDAMTPLGLWSFGTEGFFWIRLSSDPWFLGAFGLGCLGLTLSLYYLDRDNRPLFQWLRGPATAGMLRGLVGAAVGV